MTRRGAFAAIRTDGGLLPTDLLGRVTSGDSDLPGLSPEAYHLAPGERLNEAITRSWSSLTGAWTAFRTALEALPDSDRTAATLTRDRWTLHLFKELGFGRLQPAKAIAVDDKTYPVSHAWGHIPIHLPGARVDIDQRTPGVAGAASMSPHGLVQELLNRSDDALWGVVCNGLRLRLLRDNASLTRQALVEFDLDAMFSDGQGYADFVTLWMVCHQSRFEGDPPEKCLLEQWKDEAAQRGTRALDRLRDGVEQAINALGAGFLAHPANAELRRQLREGTLSTQDYYRQLLRLVYRLLFLFVAESRELDGRPVLLDPKADETAALRYRQFYALSRIRDLAESRRGSAHPDLWVALKVVFDALSSPNGAPALALPSLGSFLWSSAATPDLEGAQLANRDLLAAVRALSSTPEGRVRRLVDYRNLGAEELGSIYESLLELHPNLNADAGSFALTTAAGNERKTTGSYYTPTSLITELLDSALDPVLEAAANAHDPERAVLDLTVLDPACGSGHFLIAAAHRIARRLASVRTGEGEPSPREVRTALRDVIGRCLHGIDVNPMAVELCKVSLWMEAVEPGKPLSFLEHRIVCGNGLLGTTPKLLTDGVPDEAFKALEGDDKPTVTALKNRNKSERKRRRGGHGMLATGHSVAALAAPIAAALNELDALDDSTPEAIADKERRYRELQASTEVRAAKLAADAWCAAFVAPKRKGEPVITDATVADLTEGLVAQPAVIDRVDELAAAYQFLHPHLAFPDVFRVPEGEGESPDNAVTGWSGGFSVVLGNPPWERVKLQEKEFFAARAPEVAEASNAAARKRKIEALRTDEPELYEEFLAAARVAEGVSHLLRTSGRFPLCGRGDVNTYTVFAELMRTLIEPRGRVGSIVPSGIATDDTTKHFFGDLVTRRSLVSLFDFENRQALFADVDSRMKFCLLTLAGSGDPIDEAEFVFFAHSTADLSDVERRFTLSPEDFELLNPNTRTCPVFRTRRDAEITKGIYRRVPVLIKEGPPEENPWDVSFQRMFDMSNDSHLFRTREQLDAEGWVLKGNVFHKGEDRYLPLYEGKMLHHFDHRFAEFVGGEWVNPGHGPCDLARPRYFVPAPEGEERLRDRWWISGFRNIARSTDERSMMAALGPKAAAGNNFPTFFAREPSVCLAAVLQSLVLDFIARQKLGSTTMNFFIVEQLPVISPQQVQAGTPWSRELEVHQWLRSRIVELVYTSWDMRDLAVHEGWTGGPFPFESSRRSYLRAEVDAAFFHLYGIERDDVDYMMETFPIVKRKDVAEHGEYRTKRLILEVYDAMDKAIETGEAYQTILDPPPGDPSLCHDESTRPEWAKE